MPFKPLSQQVAAHTLPRADKVPPPESPVKTQFESAQKWLRFLA
jgi:hypothetical protein